MASNDLRGKNEYAYLLNEVNLIVVYVISFLDRMGHFAVKTVQTANKQTEIALIYIDFLSFYILSLAIGVHVSSALRGCLILIF